MCSQQDFVSGKVRFIIQTMLLYDMLLYNMTIHVRYTFPMITITYNNQ